jgi:hypothetical protein
MSARVVYLSLRSGIDGVREPLDLSSPRRQPPNPVSRDAARDHALEGHWFDPSSFAAAKLAATAQW